MVFVNRYVVARILRWLQSSIKYPDRHEKLYLTKNALTTCEIKIKQVADGDWIFSSFEKKKIDIQP
jgi:hypothetical protein